MNPQNFDNIDPSGSPSTPSAKSTGTSTIPALGTPYQPTTTTPQQQHGDPFSGCYRPQMDFYQPPYPPPQHHYYQQPYQQPYPQPPPQFYQQHPLQPPTSPPPTNTPPFCTQPSESSVASPDDKGKKKGKYVKPKKTQEEKASRLTWDSDERLFLCKAYIAVSEDATISTNQTSNSFFNRVLSVFNREWSHKNRTKDSITGQWSAIRRDTMRFHGIYSQLESSGRASGTNDSDLQRKALIEYKATYNNQNFPYLECWEFLRNQEKFHHPDESVIGRRGVRKDDGLSRETPLDLDEDAGGERMERVRVRPPGRTMSKKSQKTSSSSAPGTGGSSNSSFYESIEQKATEFQIQQAAVVAEEMQASLTLRRYTRSKQRNADLDFLKTPVDDLPPATRSVIERQKAKILEQFENGFYDE